MDVGLDFTAAEQHMIGQIVKAEKTLPDDFWHVAALQELACLMVRLEPLLPDKDMGLLVGCGALLARHGKTEMKAEIETAMMFAKIRKANP